jgi:hypothetical protein
MSELSSSTAFHTLPTARTSNGSRRLYSRSSQPNRFLNGAADSGMMIKTISPISKEIYVVLIPMPEHAGLIKYEDPETAAMTDNEILAAARAAFGTWADREEIDDPLWIDRFDDLYGPYNETPNI